MHIDEVTVTLDGATIPAVRAMLETDHPAYGGHHSVVFAGRLALEVLAFHHANGHDPLEVTVEGWLRLGKETVVVADRVMFHVSEEVRCRAAALVKSFCGPSAQGASGPVDGPGPPPLSARPKARPLGDGAQRA